MPLALKHLFLSIIAGSLFLQGTLFGNYFVNESYKLIDWKPSFKNISYIKKKEKNYDFDVIVLTSKYTSKEWLDTLNPQSNLLTFGKNKYGILTNIPYEGEDTYQDLHKKVLSLVLLRKKAFLKVDDDIILQWSKFHKCLNRCKLIDKCYIGNLHTQTHRHIRGAFKFMLGGSYFLGKDLIQCIQNRKGNILVEGMGEDKNIGILLESCITEYINCDFYYHKKMTEESLLIQFAPHPHVVQE